MARANQVTNNASLTTLQSFLKDGLAGQFQLLTIDQVHLLSLAIDDVYVNPTNPGQRPNANADRMLEIRKNQLKKAQVNCSQHRKSKEKTLTKLGHSFSHWWDSSLQYLLGLLSASDRPVQPSSKVENLKRQSQNTEIYLANGSESEQSDLLFYSDLANSCDKSKAE